MDVKEILETVPVGKRTVLDITGGADARKLTVEHRDLLPEEPRAPKRAESPRRGHEFLSAKSLANYLAAYGGSGTVVFADPVNEVIHAVLDENADEGFEILSMKPALHPLWAPWAALSGRSVGIKEFAGFVNQNRRSILTPDGRQLAAELSQVKANVSVEIEQGRGKSAVNGIIVKTQISGQTRTDVVELPDTITLRVPLYVDTDPRAVEVDLCIEARPDGDISVLVSSGTVAEARVQAFEDMVKVIRAEVEEATFTFGRPKHAGWQYLAELAAE